MREEPTSVLMTEWVEICVQTFGRELPLNYLSLSDADELQLEGEIYGEIGHQLQAADQPLVMPNGDRIRLFVLRYLYEGWHNA